jgi:hypothetical protein
MGKTGPGPDGAAKPFRISKKNLKVFVTEKGFISFASSVFIRG